MKEKIIYFLLTSVIVVLVANQFVFQKTNANTKVRWEYKISRISTSSHLASRDLNNLGGGGWELTEIQQLNEKHNDTRYYIFKRKISE